jgi:replication factor C subunit 1
MDEVDGMGAGDRSGMSELIQMIKNSKVPIICICNDRSSQKMKSLVQYCMDLRFQRPNKKTIGRRAVEIGRVEGMEVEENAAEAMSESCGNDIRQVLNCMQMWSCKKNEAGQSSSVTYKDLKDRQSDINKDEVLRVSMFDATKLIVEGPRDTGSDAKKNNDSFFKRTDAFFVDYMLMGLNIHQNYLKVCVGQYNNAKTRGDDDLELAALDAVHDATLAMSDFGIVEENLSGGDQNWALLPLCSVLAAKVGLLDNIVTTLSCCLRSKLASHFISLFPSIHPNTRLDFTPVDPLEDSCLGILSLLDGLERTQLATKKFGCWESFATT